MVLQVISNEELVKQEKEAGATFVKDRPDYETIKRDANLQQAFDFGDTIDCYCTD